MAQLLTHLTKRLARLVARLLHRRRARHRSPTRVMMDQVSEGDRLLGWPCALSVDLLDDRRGIGTEVEQ